MIAAKAFQRATIADAVAAAAIVPTPVGLAVKVLAVGLTVGIPLGVTLWETYYSGAQLSAIKTAAAPLPGWSGPGLATPSSDPNQVGTASAGYWHFVNYDDGFGGCSTSSFTHTPGLISTPGNSPYQSADQAFGVPSGQSISGWSLVAAYLGGQYKVKQGASCVTMNIWYHPYGATNPAQLVYSSGGAATQAQVKSYVQGLASGATNSLESNTQNQGVGATAPAHEAGTQTVTIINNIDNSTHVVQAPAPGDVVVNPTVPAPAQTTVNNTTTNNNTSTVTTTTTTTTNPNGSVTTVATSSDTQASVSPCVMSGHQPDTLGSILAKHQAAWKTSGLLSTLTSLKALVFAGAPPVISLPTHLFGTFTVNFGSSTWAFVFTVMQSIFLALAGLVSVRIVFGRG
jgi:hypothetical protein